MFSRIEDDGRAILIKLKLKLNELRTRVGTKSIREKKALLYLTLRNKHHYSLQEIADYCYKDHSTIHKTCKKHAKLWDKYRHMM